MFRTNFDKKYELKYRKAILIYKDKTGIDRFTIKNDAYNVNEELISNSLSLHDNSKLNTSLFWDILRDIGDDDIGGDISEKEMLLNMQYYMEYCKINEYVTPMDWILNHKHF